MKGSLGESNVDETLRWVPNVRISVRLQLQTPDTTLSSLKEKGFITKD